VSKLHELREKRAARVAEMQSLVATAEAAGRDLADNEVQRFDTLKEETRGLDQSIARAETLAELERRADADPITGHGGLADLEQRVNVLAVVRAQMEGRALSGAEAEYNAETARRLGRSAQGIFVPLRALEGRSVPERRVNLTTTAPEIVPTDHRPDLYIGPFRERLGRRTEN
jgi:HK97 family phage major capsid protein